MAKLTVLSTRGGHVESTHPISAVAVDGEGRVVDRIGEPLVTTWRSAAKPFQLETSLSLLPEQAAAALAPEDLAIGASSHHGEPGHVTQVQGVLSRFGCSVESLYCGAHFPVDGETTVRMHREGHVATAIHNNCSGKHAFMAAASRISGWQPDYRSPDHPLQSRIRASVDQRTGGTVAVVIDGCGVPCFVLPIDGMARAWAQLASAMAPGAIPTDRTAGLARIGWAMNRCWWHASGSTAIDGLVMRESTTTTVAKVGAEGLICFALPDRSLGVAIKVHSGSGPARAAAVAEVFERWFPGRLPPESLSSHRTIRNWVGTVCGELVGEWS